MKVLTVLITLGLALCGGCTQMIFNEPQRTNHYYLNPRANFPSVGRVALLEPASHSTRQELPEMMADVLADEIGKRNLFSIQKIMRTDPVWQMLNLDEIDTHTFDDLAEIRKQLNIDAILFGVIKQYHSFPHLQTTLNLKLVDVRSGHLLWAIEDVWDSGDKAVERRMKQFFNDQMRIGYEPMNWQILTTSPRAFNRFVAFETAKTLPALPENAVPQTVEHRRRYLAPQ